MNTFITKAPCKRCGRVVTTLSKSLYDLDNLKSEFGIVCKNCVTSEEEYELLIKQGLEIAKTMRE